MDLIKHLYFFNRGLPPINPNGKEIIGVSPINKNNYFEYNFDSAIDFLDIFDVNKSQLYKENNRDIFTNYLYRGHENKEWDLLPNAFRDFDENTIRAFLFGNVSKEPNDFARFVKGMDELGLNISEESYKLITLIDRNNNFNGGNVENQPNNNFVFPKKEQLNELALAQHYGIKTRLLDFTTNPLTALFFATKSAYPFSECNLNNKIGIWVIPKLLIDVVSQERKYIELINTKKFQNKYIAAQEGVFINYIPADKTNNTFFYKSESENIHKIKTLDEVLTDKYQNEYLNKIIEEHIGKPMLFTLPHSKLKEISNRLNQLNINWITMMPSLDGVKEEVMRYNRSPYTL